MDAADSRIDYLSSADCTWGDILYGIYGLKQKESLAQSNGRFYCFIAWHYLHQSAKTVLTTLGDGIILYAADNKIDIDTYDEMPVVGPQTIDKAPTNRYVIIKENEKNE